METGFIIICVASWLYVELVDPSLPGGIPCICMRKTQASSRYCSSCKKGVPGLDHHCPWLNTCIGKRNYFGFYTLTFFGTLQFLYQTLFGLAYLIPMFWKANDDIINNLEGEKYTHFVVLVVFVIVSFTTMISFSTLCIFHLYLQYLGMGTYDWILSQRPATTTYSTVKKKPSSTTSTSTTTTTTTTTDAKVSSPRTDTTVNNDNVELTSTSTNEPSKEVYSPSFGSSVDAKKALNSNDVEEGVNSSESIAIVVKSNTDEIEEQNI